MAELDLFLASGRGDLHQVQTLIEVGVDADRTVNNGDQRFACTPLHQACKLKRIEVVKYLIQNKHVKQVDALDQDQMTPLHFVCAYGCFELCRFLIEQGGANVEAKDKDGWRPLHWACYGGHEKLVRYLVEERCADVGARSNMEACWTPLTLACRFKHLAVVRYLVPESLSVDETAFRFAFTKSFPWDVKLLLLQHCGRATGRPSNYSKDYPAHAVFLCPLPSESAYMQYVDLLDSSSFSIVDERGRLPLHMALDASSEKICVSPSVLLKLVGRETSAAYTRDPASGLYPFQTAASLAGATIPSHEEHVDHDKKWVDLVYQLSRTYDPELLFGQ